MSSIRRHPGRRARLAAIALLGFAPLTNCMCANVQRNRAYRDQLQASINGYVHQGDRAAVVEEVRTVVETRGHQLPSWDGRTPATTEWKTDPHSRTRHHVALVVQAPGYLVRLTKQVQRKAPPQWAPHSHDRDAEVEAAVLERVHPGKEEALGAGAVSDYIYDVAPAVLWAAATEELSQHGAWMSRNDAPVDVTASTGWVVYEGEEPSRVRHDVRIVPVATHRHRLEVHRTVEHGEGPRRWETESERRDYDVELTLIRHRDPAAASAIEAEAQAEGQAAFERAVDAGAVSCGR